MEVRDINARFVYKPGAVLVFSGNMLQHQVRDWKTGERICLAFFMKKAVLERLTEKAFDRGWVRLRDFDLGMEEERESSASHASKRKHKKRKGSHIMN